MSVLVLRLQIFVLKFEVLKIRVLVLRLGVLVLTVWVLNPSLGNSQTWSQNVFMEKVYQVPAVW